jgi:hypothetical protein
MSGLVQWVNRCMLLGAVAFIAACGTVPTQPQPLHDDPPMASEHEDDVEHRASPVPSGG